MLGNAAINSFGSLGNHKCFLFLLLLKILLQPKVKVYSRRQKGVNLPQEMAENNKLSASSDYPLSDVSTEMNVSASLSNNDSTGNASTVTAANPPSSTPDLKNVQDLTRYVWHVDEKGSIRWNVTIYYWFFRLSCYFSRCRRDFKPSRIKCCREISFLHKKTLLFYFTKNLHFFLNLYFTWWYGKPYWWFREEHCRSCHPIWSWRTTKIGWKHFIQSLHTLTHQSSTASLLGCFTIEQLLY